MTQLVLDTFTGSADVDLATHVGEVGATWLSGENITAMGGTPSGSVASYKLDGSGAVTNGGVTNPIPIYPSGSVDCGDAFTLELDLTFDAAGGPWTGFLTNPTTGNGYALSWYVLADYFEIDVFKMTDGSLSFLDFFSTDPIIATGQHTLKIVSAGAAKTFYLDDVEHLSITDDTYTSGVCWIQMWDMPDAGFSRISLEDGEESTPPGLVGSGNGVDATYPNSLPLWLAEGHGFENTPLTDDVRFEQGEDRDRQLYTWAPQIASVSALYSQAQYDRWVDFYEEELQAGTKSFATRVAHQSGGIVEWWTAQIVAPPREETLNKAGAAGNLYRVSMQLLLLDGPFENHTPATLRASVQTRIGLKATSNVGDGVLRGLISSAAGMRATSTIPTRITEAGAGRVTEDGLVRSLES